MPELVSNIRDIMWSRRLMAFGLLLPIALAGCGNANATPTSDSVPIGDVWVDAEDGEVNPASVSDAVAPVPEDICESEPPTEVARMFAAGDVRSVRLIGDSITAGYGCDGYADVAGVGGRTVYQGSEGTFSETPDGVSCWANDFRSYATQHGVTDFVNAGISGAKMQWLTQEPDAWLGDGADVIFVMLGTNDAVYSTPEEYAADAEAALLAVSERCRQMVVVSPPANERTDATNRYGAEVLDQALRDICARRGYQHVSLLNSLNVHSSDLNADLCHPTSVGSHKIWNAMRAALGL